MRSNKQALFISLIVLIVLSACRAATSIIATPTPLPLPTQTALPPATQTLAPLDTATPPAPEATETVASTATLPATATRPAAVGDVRACAYVPGVSQPAQMPPEVLFAATATPFPKPTLPAPSKVEASVTEQQMKVFQQIYDLVEKNYVYRDFNGQDWKATGERYKALIQKGLAPKDFYFAMSMLIAGLGDQHSAYLSPDDAKQLANEMLGKMDYVGIGAYVDLSTVEGRAIITSVMRGSPAEEAGLLPHDAILSVDGGPVLDKDHLPRTLGPEGTSLTISVQTPGQPARDVSLTRRRITSQPRVDFCLVPGTHIGYIRWFSYADTTVVTQTVNALEKMSADQPLEGLILDNRYNTGGLISVLEGILSLFTHGKMGDFVSEQGSEPMEITPQDVNGSQSVPLVVLIGPNSFSAAEYASGLLHLTRGARLVGQNTAGTVEELMSFELEDGGRLNLAIRTFQPLGLSNNAWEIHGVAPDVVVPERWDLFSEASDPAFARALDLLMSK